MVDCFNTTFNTIYFRKELVKKYLEILQNNILKITFVKMDGTIRVMRCTINHKNNNFSYYSQKDFESSHDITVLDVDKLELRKFNINRVIDIEFISTK